MCGICGFSGRPDEKALMRMTNSIFHRGPDDEGYYADGRMNLGMRRLSIVDLASGRQPISNEDGSIWVVFNGEIYNHRELRKDLESKGHCFTTDHSDTEVIVHLYEEYGEDWATYVNGMFGVALWDARKERLLLYRDRIGKKPLYYAVRGDQIIFGSEIKAILQHPAVSQELDYHSIYHYFGLKNTSAPNTAYNGIKQLLPGYVLVMQGGELKTHPYWKLDFSDPLTDISEEEAAQHLYDLFKDAVRLRMQCDVPFGAYLSGGIDSSSVVSMMVQHHSKPVMTFCLGYKEEPEGQFYGKAQDIQYAREMSQQLGTEHYECIIDATQFAAQMPEILHAFDEPFSGTISTFFLSILIKEHVKVALSGDGADELFGSYLAHRLALPIENYLRMWKRGLKSWRDLSEQDKASLAPFDNSEQFQFLQSIASSSIIEWRKRLCVFNESERGQLLSEDLLRRIGYPNVGNDYQTIEAEITGKDMLNKSLELEQREPLPNQVLPFVDRLSMAHSIEVRVPYLDYRIIEFSNKLPGKLKIKNGIVKYIHKKTMEKILPAKLVRRPKEGFVQPIYTWMQGRLKGWVQENLDSLQKEVFNLDYVRNLSKAFQAGDQSLNAKVWNLVCFNIWYEGLSKK